MSTPVVSVIIPTFNRAAMLQRAVDSVLLQTFAAWECIVVDDASDDMTRSVLADLRAGDRRFVTRRLPARSGNTLARSTACSMARGEFLAILDDDDWWEPMKLERQVAAMRAASGATWSYHAAQLVSTAGRGDIEPVQHGDDFLQRLVQYNWLRHSSMMFRRAAFEAVGGYDQRLKLASDWDLALRLTLRFGQDAVVTLPDPLVNYWQHADAISTNSAVRNLAERRLVRRALLREGMLWKNTGLALRMLDRQLDREMHCALSEGRRFRALAASVFSASARPFRAWRWRRAATFAGSMVTGWRPRADAPPETAAVPSLFHPGATAGLRANANGQGMDSRTTHAEANDRGLGHTRAREPVHVA
jgi:glycosyltransferase involved in cell wall biosynthesis